MASTKPAMDIGFVDMSEVSTSMSCAHLDRLLVERAGSDDPTIAAVAAADGLYGFFGS